MNNRGSEWHKWDLHVHTPESICHHFQAGEAGDVWEQYIYDLEHLPENIKVLGINDYLFIDGYRRVLEYKRSGRLANIDLILPVVELRLDKFGGHNSDFKRINFHVIFSDEVEADVIQSQFLNALHSKYKLTPGYDGVTWGGVVTRENLADLGRRIKQSVPDEKRRHFGADIEEGFNNLNFSFEDITGILQGAPQYFKGKYITAIGKTEWDAIRWNDQSIAEKKTIINSVDFIFSAAESVDAYQVGYQKLESACVNHILLDCSDAHHNLTTTEKDRLGNCNTWIKAQLSFEGLKQVLYEPSERLRIQINEPDEKNVYQVIDSVSLNEDAFWTGRIYLNKNLNTIIGGRSTGKSTLLKGIAAKVDDAKILPTDGFIRSHLMGITIDWKDGGNSLRRDIEYFPQSYMHSIAFDPQQTNALVDDVIRHKDNEHILRNYDEQKVEIQRYMAEHVFLLFQKQREINDLTQVLLEKGNREGVVQQLAIHNARLVELQRNSALTIEEKEQYDNYVRELTEHQKSLETISADIQILKTFSTATPFNHKYLETWHWNDLSWGLNQSELQRLYKNLVVKTENEWTAIVQSFIDNTTAHQKRIETQIAAILSNPIYQKGLSAFKGNAEIQDVQKQIEEENRKLFEIEKLNKDKDLLVDQREVAISEIVNKHITLKALAADAAERLRFVYEGLDVGVELLFHGDEMRGFLENRLNLRGNERQEYVQRLCSQYDADVELYTLDFLRKMLANQIAFKNNNEARNVATEFLSKSWYSLDYQLTYQNDAFKDMSEGKQAFVILKLLLDFSDKKCPILIDQPEDSLDNRAIYNELVAYLKKKKRERQIILVTHNSNVVVSADAENVIIANQDGINTPNKDGYKFQYINGALEETREKNTSEKIVLQSQGIREHVCEILEGGKDAFIKRERKYGFN